MRCPEFLSHPLKYRFKLFVFATAVSVILFGTGLRFWKLSRPVVWEAEATTMLCVAGQDLYKVRAEIMTINFAEIRQKFQEPGSRTSLRQVIRSIPPLYGPLNYELIYYWGKLAGYKIASVRLVPAIVGTLVIAAAFWLGIELFHSAWAAGLAATLVAISPLVIHFSREIREPILVILFTILAAAAFLRARKTGKIRDWVIYAVVTAAGVYSSLTAGLTLLTNGIFALVTRRAGTEKILNKRSMALLLASLFALLLSAPRLIGFASKYQRAAISIAWTATKIPTETLLSCWWRNFSWPFLFPGEATEFLPLVWDCSVLFPLPEGAVDAQPILNGTIWPAIIMSSSWMFFLISLFAIVTAFRFDRKNTFLFLGLMSAISLCTTYLPDLLFGGMRSIIVRYVLQFCIALIFFVSFACWHYARSPIRWQRGAAYAIVAFLVLSGIVGSTYDVTCLERTAFQNLIPMIRVLNKEKDVLVVSTERPKECTNFTQLLALSHKVPGSIRCIWLGMNRADELQELLPADTTRFYLFSPLPKLRKAAWQLGFKEHALPDAPFLIEFRK